MKNVKKIEQTKSKNQVSGSTKATSSLFDQGFLSQKLMGSKNKKLNSKIGNNKIPKNIFDLERTLDINLEIIKNCCKYGNSTKNNSSVNQNKKIIDNIENFLSNYNKKKEIIKKIKEIKSKILIQNQICLENKRKLEQTVNNCKESLIDNEDAVNNKDEYVKLFQKKFVEVEIYLQRLTSDMEDFERKKYYQNYKMDIFTNLNTNYHKTKERLNKEIEKYKMMKKKVKSENTKILKEEKILLREDKKLDQQMDKKNELIKKKNEEKEKMYKNLINKKVSILNQLKKFSNYYLNIDNLLNTNIQKEENINKKSISNGIPKPEIKAEHMFKKIEVGKSKIERDTHKKVKGKEKTKNERSILPFDMTKRMNSFMDLSALNGSKPKESKIGISKIWGDVSAIEKVDE